MERTANLMVSSLYYVLHQQAVSVHTQLCGACRGLSALTVPHGQAAWLTEDKM